MTEINADAALLSVPVPLQGCLYCHTEGSTALGESRPLLGLGASIPIITCSSCGAVAQFEASDDPNHPDQWRIRYRSVNKAPRFYYVMIHLGQAGWLDAQTALAESRRGFVQRQWMQRTQRGDLTWLHPVSLEPTPPLMSPDEQVYLMLNPASLFQAVRGGRALGRGDDTLQDTGRFYVTDRKLHLLGHRRDWSHKLSDVQRAEQTDHHWRVYIGDGSQYYQGENLPNQLDAQLFAAAVKALCKQE